MSKAKDFQLVTAERIIEIFKSGRKRVLLSDEVGLGKTIMARTVVEMAKNLPGVEDDGIYRVVYVCSNQNIIQQNTRNLGIPQKDIMQMRDSRLSMQHLILQERKIQQDDGDGTELPQQLIPLTPSTSFSITGGAGNGSERALIYAILKEMDEFEGKDSRLSWLMKTIYMGQKNWESLVTDYCARVDKCGPEYKASIIRQLRQNKIFKENKNAIIDLVNGDAQEMPFWAINKLRIAFAQVSLNQLEPDLVIMDEFQRFSGLLNTNSESEESMIAHEFFANEHPYILLLSATPYKPFTTLEELNEDNCDEQYEDFLKLMRFLFKSEDSASESFHKVWEDYSNKLSHISSKSFDALVISKQRAEDKMYKVICRTERYSEGLVKTTPLDKMAITGDDILAYCQMQKLLQKAKKILERKRRSGKNIGVNPSYNIPIEYVKSAPYLLSFMQKYQEGKTVEIAFHGRDIPIIKNSRAQRLLLKSGQIYNYKKIDAGNAKLALIEDMLFKNHAERLLWVPASHPYYSIPATNVFAQNKDFSKVLVFSAWEMVPRMLAVMLSYVSEQRNVAGAYKNDGITYITKKKVGMNRMQEEGGDLLEYPSSYLADCFDPKHYFGQDIETIIHDLQKRIQADIDLFELPTRNVTSAESLLTLIHKLEGNNVEIHEIPLRAAKTLAYMAIASPAVCMLRILRKAIKTDDASPDYDIINARDVADNIVNLFNRRENSAAVELTTPKELKYYEQVLYYCVMGNLQAVLDEYCHMIDEGNHADLIVEKLNRTFISATPYRIHTTESYCKENGRPMPMRRSFAFDYAKIIQDKNLKHNGTLQQAFNSPFRPFVLATTSVGQEGLDFHWYTRKILHWNLPSNPVDLEQREGRVNRYKCLAIRRNIAKFFGAYYSWEEMFNEADKHWRKESVVKYSEMVPYWCLPKEIIRGQKENLEYIERLVPLYPMSLDQLRYKHLIEVLSLYRLTMGQPRQEELLQLLEGKVTKEQMKELLFDLSPYNRSNKQLNK
jgi:hypothetical protein